MIELGCRGRALMAAALHGQQQAGEGNGRTTGMAGGPADHARGDRDMRARGSADDRAGVLVSALDDRRQRAREAFYDAPGIPYDGEGVEAAIETATRVQITPEISRAAFGSGSVLSLAKAREILARAFEAAGFEVEPS